MVEIDLEKFFDEVNHDRLMSRLKQRIAGRRVLMLIRQMLRAKVVLPDGVLVSSERGTPQGGPLSPLLSNIVLDGLDRELEQRGHRFVRYADDCNVYVRSERAGQRVMESLKAFIEKHLKLKVNSSKSSVARPYDRKFLSLNLQRLKTSGVVRVMVADQALRKLESELKALTPRNWGQSIEDCIRRVNVYLRGWLGYFAVCDEKQRATLGRINGHLRRRLRAMILKQWKRKRYIVNGLIRLRVPSALARMDIHVYRRTWWALSKARAVQRGLTNEYLARRGLIALYEDWQTHHDRIWDIGPEQLTLQKAYLRHHASAAGPNPARALAERMNARNISHVNRWLAQLGRSRDAPIIRGSQQVHELGADRHPVWSSYPLQNGRQSQSEAEHPRGAHRARTKRDRR